MFLLPFAPDLAGTHGGARATAEIVDLLSRKHDVLVLYLAPQGAAAIQHPPGNRARLIPVQIASRPKELGGGLRRTVDALRCLLWDVPGWVKETWSETMAAAIETNAAEFRPDVVHCEFHVMAQYIPTLRNVVPEAPCVVTEHEIGLVAAADHGNERGGIWRWLGSAARKRSWARFEGLALSRADAVVAFTEKDCSVVRDLLGPSGPPCTAIPFQLRASADDGLGQEPIPSDLLFVGNFRHPPNVDAAIRLVDTIFPAIKEALPTATLYIVGADPPKELIAASKPGVAVTGWVESPRPYLEGAKLMLAPLRQGGGMRVKVIEACAAGKALIASATAVEGLELRPGVEFEPANSDEEFVHCAIYLLKNPQRRDRLGEAARQWALRAQDSAEWLARYEALYERLRV